MKKKVMITGAGGQVGSQFSSVLNSLPYDVFSYTREQLDLTNYNAVSQEVARCHPDIIINCAALTDVDRAEHNEKQAYTINAYAAKHLADEARQIGAKLVYLSTNYLFDGNGDVPYKEGDTPAPINIYGQSKLLGEQFIKRAMKDYFIVRTSWIFGLTGKNFFHYVLAASQQKLPIHIVGAQISSPTYSDDLVSITTKLMETENFGTYHVTNSGTCTRYEFAEAILNLANYEGILQKVDTSSQSAMRPAFSVLAHQELHSLRIKPRHWKEALSDCMSLKSGVSDGKL